MDLLNDVVIQCEECGNRIVIQKEYLEPECSSYERGMGAEIAYDIYEECDCEVCGNHINYRISGYEYPAGCFNYEDNEIHGGRFLERPCMGIVYRVEFDEDNINSFLPLVDEYINMILNDKKFVYQLTPREFEEVVEEEELVDDGELVAVITAAIMAANGGAAVSADKLVVRSIKRVKRR